MDLYENYGPPPTLSKMLSGKKILANFEMKTCKEELSHGFNSLPSCLDKLMVLFASLFCLSHMFR